MSIVSGFLPLGLPLTISYYPIKMLNVLARFPLFHDLDDDELKIISPFFSAADFKKGTVLFSQGDAANNLYLVLSGQVEILYKPYDGPELTLTTIKVGGIVGWSAVLGNTAYTSSAICVSDCNLLAINGSVLRRLCDHYPEVGELILDRMSMVASNRWENAREQVMSMLVRGVSGNGFSYPRGDEFMATTPANQTMNDQLIGLIEQLSAYIEQFHGGSVEFVSFDGKKLKVHLGGACLGCPLSPATLHGWVAGTVRQFFPEIETVEAV